MKYKLIQILLGALGSAITVLISHLANMPADATVGAAMSVGPVTAAAFGNAFRA